MIRRTSLCLVLLIALVGCSNTPEKPPQWSTGVAEQYPSSRYITAIGEASSRELAEQRALSALARIFEVTIQEDSLDFSLFRQDTGQAAEAVNRQINSRQLITATDQLLEGAVPVEHWNRDQRYLVLVALERSGAEQRLRQKIAQLDQQITALSHYAETPSLNSVIQISALEQARQLQRQRIPLNRNLSVVSGMQITPPITLAELQQQIRDRLTALRFALPPESDIASLLEHAVAQIGAAVAADAELLLSASLDLEPVAWQQGWYWQRGSLQLILSSREGSVIAQQRWPVKISAQEEGLVEQRLRDQINATIADRLFQLVTSTQLEP